MSRFIINGGVLGASLQTNYNQTINITLSTDKSLRPELGDFVENKDGVLVKAKDQINGVLGEIVINMGLMRVKDNAYVKAKASETIKEGNALKFENGVVTKTTLNDPLLIGTALTDNLTINGVNAVGLAFDFTKPLLINQPPTPPTQPQPPKPTKETH